MFMEVCLLRQGPMDRRLYFSDTEGLAGNLVERFGVDEILIAQNGLELASIHLGNEDFFIAAQQRTQVAGQWPQMADVDVADIGARGAGAPHALAGSPRRSSPSRQRRVCRLQCRA